MGEEITAVDAKPADACSGPLISAAPVSPHGYSNPGSSLVSRCRGLFSSLCLGLCTSRSTSVLWFRSFSINSFLVSQPYIFYCSSLLFVAFGTFIRKHLSVCVYPLSLFFIPLPPPLVSEHPSPLLLYLGAWR